MSVREDVRKEFENSGNNILVGNVSILGTGINIKRLNMFLDLNKVILTSNLVNWANIEIALFEVGSSSY